MLLEPPSLSISTTISEVLELCQILECSMQLIPCFVWLVLVGIVLQAMVFLGCQLSICEKFWKIKFCLYMKYLYMLFSKIDWWISSILSIIWLFFTAILLPDFLQALTTVLISVFHHKVSLRHTWPPLVKP